MDDIGNERWRCCVDRGKYRQTRRGQASAMLKRRLRRFGFMIDQEPQSKNIRPVDAVAFQKALLAQLVASEQSAYTGPVFLQMEFFTKSKTPPAIYKLPKNYLDLMETPRDDSGIDRQNLLYRNDRQVKSLVVRYHLDGPFEHPQIWVRAEPFRHFMADVELVERVGRDDFADDGYSWRGSGSEEFREGPFHSDDSWDDDDFDRLVEFEREKESWLRVMSNDAYEAQRHMMRMTVQRDHLRRTDRSICRGVLATFQDLPRTKDLPHEDMMTRLAALTRNMTLGEPFALELHHAPHRKGDSEAFDKALRTALNDFKTKHPFLFPLSSLLSVTILMVPPEGGGKDLDNLVRLILPALHEIWAPPSHIVHALKTKTLKDQKLLAFWESERAALPKEPKHSITEYRVFEIPRFPDDPKDGLVRLAVGEGMTPVRFREEIEDFLNRWRDVVER
jgi:hypothetical protein